MSTPPTLHLNRIAAGVYETPDGRHRIVRQAWDGSGPRGGTSTLWEHATPDRWSGWVLQGPLGDTLREARMRLAEQLDEAKPRRAPDRCPACNEPRSSTDHDIDGVELAHFACGTEQWAGEDPMQTGTCERIAELVDAIKEWQATGDVSHSGTNRRIQAENQLRHVITEEPDA